jgi:hypothetical protein
MPFTATNFDNIVNEALDFHMRGTALAQNIADKPLMRMLREKQKTFPSGKDLITKPVQGSWMAENGSFFQGFSQTDQVNYVHPDNTLRAKYPWYMVHAGLVLTKEELLQDGISVLDDLGGARTAKHDDRELTAITDLMDSKLNDLTESWAIKFNLMLWDDGTTDPKASLGIRQILTDTPAVGTTGELSRATYAWWRHRTAIGANKIAASKTDQTLTRRLRYEVRQLRRWGAKPDLWLAGSNFLDLLEMEVQEKGDYTQTGFVNNGKNEIGMADINMRGVGACVYDPTMDDIGWSNRCIMADRRTLQLMPMASEDTVTHNPARPYDQYVVLRSLTWVGGLCCWQLNGQGVYEAA